MTETCHMAHGVHTYKEYHTHTWYFNQKGTDKCTKSLKHKLEKFSLTYGVSSESSKQWFWEAN